MDKNLALQIVVAVFTTMAVFAIGMTVVNSMMDASVGMMQERLNGTVCDNLTQENYNLTPNHDWCTFNETSGLYELAPIQLWNVRGV